MSLRTARPKVLAALTTIVLALAVFLSLDSLPAGLRVTYTSSTPGSATSPEPGLDRRPSRIGLLAAWSGRPPENFSTTWTGTFLALRGGTYTFATRSDDGSMVYVDGRRVVDNGGQHESHLATGTIDLTAGVHTIQIEYTQ